MTADSRLKKIMLGIAFSLGWCVSAGAQSDPPPLQIGSVTFSGNIRERYEVWDWFPSKGQDFYSYSGTLMRFAL